MLKTIETRVLSRRDVMDPATYEWIDSVSDRSFVFEDIDPFHRVFKLRDGIYDIFEESADGMGDIWLHLIDGPEKAMLIDTGFGIGNLKAVCDRLTGGKPIIAVNTHEHLDHAMGNCQFGTAYCHKCGVPGVTKLMSPHQWDNLFDENGKGKWLLCERKDAIEYCAYTLVPIEEGHIFHLGEGHDIEVFHLPGHALGGAAYLDKKNRILFTGGLHTNYVGTSNASREAEKPFAEFCTVTSFRDALVNISHRMGEFDRIFNAHEILDLDSSFILDMIEVLNAVISDPDCYDYTGLKKGKELRYKMMNNKAGIRYTVDNII